jgi:hypothetical protein
MRAEGDYFFYHHTTADTVTLLDSDQMDRSAAVLAVTAYAVAMLDTKLPRGGPYALQPPEERALINAQIASGGGGQCPVESGGVVADILTPAQCAVVMSSFSTACPEPQGGWSTATAAQYTCTDECARIFVTAYTQCRTTYEQSIAGQTEETQAAVLALVGSEGSPCRVSFRQLVETRMASVASDPTCGPIYETCMGDAECREDLAEAWGSTLVDAAETRFESTICRTSREFRLLYECADNMPVAGNVGNGGWQMSDCWTRDELPPSVCDYLTSNIRTQCSQPNGGWSVETARSYQCSDTCARAIVGAFHYCGTTMGQALQADVNGNADALYVLLDNNPPGPCRETFANIVETGLQRVASGTCSHEYNQCMTSSWCRNNVRDAVGANLAVPEAEAAYELGLCGMSPEYQQLYQCVDVAGSGTPWRMASCAAPDRLRYFQCQQLITEISDGACPAPPGGRWSPSAAAYYQCSDDCATKLYTAYFECQTSWFREVDTWEDNFKASLFALVKQAPQPGPCAAVFQAGVESRIAVVAQDPVCAPLYNACARDMECRRSIGEGIGAMGYQPSRILFESTVCERPIEYQELLECAYAMDTDALDSRLSGYRPWRRTQCLEADILPPVFCNYMMDNINASCPSDGRPFTPENAATYDCPEDCARTITTTWYYCQTSFYLRSKEWPTEGRMALRTLVSQDPPGPCTATFRGLVSARMTELEADPQCGPIYDVCVADPWCLANLQDAIRALSNEYTVEGFEDHMCDARQSEKFRWLYECVDRQRDGVDAWTRAECAEPDVLRPSQCAVLIEDFEPDSTHPACSTPVGGWTIDAIDGYTCSEQCAAALTTVWRDCQTSWWHFTDTWDEEGRRTLYALVNPDPEYPGPCAETRKNQIETVMTTLRESAQCGEAYVGCLSDYHCRGELRDAFGRTLSLPSRIEFEGGMCDKSWQLQELYACAATISTPTLNGQYYPPWTRSRCWETDKVPPSVCEAISADLFGPRAKCAGVEALTLETASDYQCSLDCAKGLTDYWYYCSTTFGQYEQTMMTYSERQIWYTVIDWDQTSPGPCDNTMREYVSGVIRDIERGPCALAYDNCVGGANDARCTYDLRDAISALQAPEYARADFESKMCSKSQDFQWLYMCLRQNDIPPNLAGNTDEPWSMASCAAPDRLTGTQCSVLFDELPNSCTPPAGGAWTPRSAFTYSCSEGCARTLFAAAQECQTSYAAHVSADYSREEQFALFILMNPGPVNPGACYTTRRETVVARISDIAADTECGPLYSTCFEDPECRPVIREAIESMGYGPSRILFESHLCEKPWAYQQLHQCVAAKIDFPDGAEYKPWRVTACLEMDHLPPVYCNYMMDDLRNVCAPQEGVPFTAEGMQSYQCSENCARSLTTVYFHCQTSWYLRVKEWPVEAKQAFGVMVSQDPPGPCTQTFRSMVSERLVELETDPECGPLYDACVADGWCLANLRDGVQAVQQEFLIEGFEDHLCGQKWSTKFQRLYECTDRQRDGPNAWTRAECAAPDVLKPGQCAVLIDRFTPDSTHPACDAPAEGWEALGMHLAAGHWDHLDAYTCSMECAAALVTVYNECQTSWWHYTDTWPEEARSTLMALVSRDAEYPGPCTQTFRSAIEETFTAIREDPMCGPKYIRCFSDYGCREEVRAGIAATFTPPAKMNFESGICDMSWQFHELYECAEMIRPDWQPAPGMPPVRRWTQSRCWERDSVPPPVCDEIFEATGAACAINGVPWFGGDGVLTPETAEAYTCPLDCARAIQDAWNHCQTSFGTYTTTQMTADQRTVWYTLIDWSEDSPGPCQATFRNYVRERITEVAMGPCRLAYNNCVGGQNQGWCTRNLGDAIGALQSEYARETWEQQMCSTSPDFQWLYQCLREEDVANGVRTDQVATAWRAASCAPADKLTYVQCQNLVGRGGISAVCPAPSGGWSPQAAMEYSCSADCARMLFAAVNECPTTFSSYVDTWPREAKFSLFTLMNRGSTNPGACVTTRRESVGNTLAIVAADPDCGPKYNKCFEDIACRENIREGIEALGYAPSRVLFESTMCSRPVAYQELHECTTGKVAEYLGARETGDWSRAWRRVSCLVPDEIPPIFCNGILNNLNVSCPTTPGFVFNAESAATYDCSEDCAKSLTTAWHYCQTSFYMLTQEWDQNGRDFLVHLVAGAPDLQAEGYVGPCAAKQGDLVEATLTAVESDPQCGPIYDECVVDGWCLYNLKDAVQALQSEYVRPSFEAKMCDSDKSATFQRLYECVDRQREGASGWTRAECAAPDILTPSQCSVVLESFEDGSSHPACTTPAGGWNVAAIYDGYQCTDECANMLTTVFKYCQTSWFRLVMSNANGWDEEARETLRAMVSPDPEYPGPCMQTRKDIVSSTFDMLRNDAVCAPKYWDCMTDYDCRVELGEAIGAALTPWSKTRYESDMCMRTWQLQELYQCYSDLSATDGPSRARAWKRDRCLIPDKAAPPACNQIIDNIRLDCPDINTLTVEEARTTECSDMCAKSVVTAWSWCQTSYSQRIRSLSDERRAVVWTLINWDEDEPGPCTSTFFDLVGARMREIETGPCARAYNNCVGGQNRDQCLPELREAIGALQTENANARTLFEATMCQKSRDFQWLYSCVRHSDDSVPDADAWSPSACSPSDLLSPVTCNALIGDFREGAVCPAPRSGSWTPQSASTYDCTPGCAASLMTAFYECPHSFSRLVDEFPREGRLALFVLTQGWSDPSSDQKGACTDTLQDMVSTGLGRVRDDATCGPLFDECYADLTCRKAIRDGIRAGFNVHAIRAYQSNMCSKPRAYQELYQCMASMDWGTEVPDNYTPWSRLKCVQEDKLETEDCTTLLAAVRPSCPGTNFLDATSAENYQCSADCAKALVTVMSQCQTTLVNQASTWTQDEKDAFAVLVRGGPGSEEAPGPCERVFGPLVFQGFTQIAADAECGQYFDACVGRNDNWCRTNLREGTAASLAPASRSKFESRLCKEASPEYQDLYECVAASGFAGDDVWTKEKCLSGEYDEGSGGWYFGPIGLIFGLAIGYFCARKSLARQQGGAYRSVNESEVRNLIREYVDTSGITKTSKAGDSESMYEATP